MKGLGATQHVILALLLLLALPTRGEEYGYPEGPHGIEFVQLHAIASLSAGEWVPLSGTPMQVHTAHAAILRVSNMERTLCDGDRPLLLVEGLAILPSGEHQLRFCRDETFGPDASLIYIRIDY